MEQFNIRKNSAAIMSALFVTITVIYFISPCVAQDNEDKEKKITENERKIAKDFGMVTFAVPTSFWKYQKQAGVPYNFKMAGVRFYIVRERDYETGDGFFKCSEITYGNSHVRGECPLAAREMRYEIVNRKSIKFPWLAKGGEIVRFALCPGEYSLQMAFENAQGGGFGGPSQHINVRAGQIYEVRFE